MSYCVPDKRKNGLNCDGSRVWVCTVTLLPAMWSGMLLRLYSLLNTIGHGAAVAVFCMLCMPLYALLQRWVLWHPVCLVPFFVGFGGAGFDGHVQTFSVQK